MKSWNPRYVHYATSKGRTPADQLATDKEEWPGGCMVGFSLWIRDRISAFRSVQPNAFMMGGCGWALIDHAAFDAWLPSNLS